MSPTIADRSERNYETFFNLFFIVRVLIACEFSGVVREAFQSKGHFAMSCDLRDTMLQGHHYKGDVLDIINDGWDLLIAFPPCTYLTTTGNRWMFHPDDKDKPSELRRPHPRYPNRLEDRRKALDFVNTLLEAPIEKIALENPVGVISTNIRKPDQKIQPFEFGEPYEKQTCLWLKNLPKLVPTNIVEPKPKVLMKNGKYLSAWYHETSNRTKSKREALRSTTFEGIAKAMAKQWG